MIKAHKECLNILHIEDDPQDARLIEDRLDLLGFKHRTIRVLTGDAFRAELEQHQPDVVLSDSGLPTLDAFDALAIVRDNHPDVPFVFLTGNASPDIQRQAREQGAFDYVVKNNLRQLTKTLRRVCANLKRTQNPMMLPCIHQNVVVRCPRYQCMAYLDPDGSWRDFRTAMELPDVLNWFAP